MEEAKAIPGNFPEVTKAFDGNRVINLCPHEVNAMVNIDGEDTLVRFPKYQKTPRVEYNYSPGVLPNTRVMLPTEIKDLPKPMPNIYYLVSRETARVAKELYRREDFLSPGPQIRNVDNKVVACKGLIKN